MFCQNCGAKAYGPYCSQCGAKIIGWEGESESAQRDWREEVRYEGLMSYPEVRDTLSRCASRTGFRLSGEEFLKLCDELIETVPGVSLSAIGSIAHRVYSAMGIKTGKVRREFFSAPVGKVIVGVLCSLARRGMDLKGVEQGENGCLFRAVIPSDLWSFAGELVVVVERVEGGTSVEASALIRGQLFDWGKSRRTLERLFGDIGNFLDGV